MRAGALLKLDEAARELDVSVSTLKRRIRAGALPVFRDGRIVRVREADLVRYHLERVARATPPAAPMRRGGARKGSKTEGGRLWDPHTTRG